MANHVDELDENAIVFDGFQEGIADNPYDGISDMRNVNIISVPGEASVNFETNLDSGSSFQNVSVTSADSGTNIITFASSHGLQTGQAVIFSSTGIGTSVGTLNAGPYYWLEVLSDTTAKLYPTPGRVFVTSVSNGTTTFSTVDMALPKYFAYDTVSGATYVVDSTGRVWTNMEQKLQILSYFSFTGNKVPDAAYTTGNGLVVYASSDLSYRYLFVFHDQSVDYALVGASLTWVYQWNPTTGAALGFAAHTTKILQSTYGTQSGHLSHECLLAPTNEVYFCDANYIGRFYQADISPAFNPTSGSQSPSNPSGTYIYDSTFMLPYSDICQCLAWLGQNLMIGGKKNIIYPWDTLSHLTGTLLSSLPSLPILLAESNIQKMVTVNTNTYALVGNRGRIYVTNGSQAQLWKKIPDHISGTVEPYFTWGGLTSQKNQIYFSFLAETNQGGNITTYGGVWACDVDTEALRLTNKLSYDTYGGYASALIPNYATNPAGTGLFIGWYDGVSAYGVDQTVSSLYTNNQAEISTELVNIGTFYIPKTFKTVEYKLTTPLAVGESVTMYWRKLFSDAWTPIWTSTAVGEISDNHPVNFENAQWIQLKIVLNSI